MSYRYLDAQHRYDEQLLQELNGLVTEPETVVELPYKLAGDEIDELRAMASAMAADALKLAADDDSPELAARAQVDTFLIASKENCS